MFLAIQHVIWQNRRWSICRSLRVWNIPKRYSFSVSQPSRVVRLASRVFVFFGKRVLMLRVVVTRITKSRLQGNHSRLRRFGKGYSPWIGIHKMRNGQVCLRLVLVQKRTRLESLGRTMGRLYTWGLRNTAKETRYKYKEGTSRLSKYSYIKGDGHQEETD